MGPTKARLLWDKEDWKNSIGFYPLGKKRQLFFQSDAPGIACLQDK